MSSGGMICIPRFMKIDMDAEGILRFCPNNLKGCNASITAESDF
jgi:hypothetical protein